jgi:pimeloyl-[acyl-carrier protein] methyl ester esterase
LFAPLLDALGDAVQTSVVRYADEHSFDDYIDTAAKAVSRPNTVLVAESFSGPVALALCARRHANITGLVLCATFAESPFRSLLHLVRFTPNALFGPSPTQPYMLRHACLNGERNDQLLQRAVTVLRSVPAASMQERLATLATIDVRPLLPAVQVPALYLRATRDRVVSSRLSRALTDRLANVSIENINGPHLLLQARPRECAKAILRFVKRA